MNLMIYIAISIVFGTLCFCYGYGIGKSNKKREYIPMKFESKPIKVLVVQYRHFGSSEEMARTEWRVKRDVKSGVVFLPNDCTYEFGEVERVVITGSDSVI